MIYVELFWNFLMIGALSFGGGYGMISLVRETVLGHGWLTEGEFLSFIAVSESTPGPLAINMATFIGASQGGFWGALCATLGVVLPSFVIILLVASVLQNLMKYAGVNAVLGGVRPCVVAMILATAINMALSTLLGFAGRSTVQGNHARAPFARNGVGVETVAGLDVVDVDLLIFDDAGRIQQIQVNTTGSFIIQHRMSNASLMQLASEHNSLHCISSFNHHRNPSGRGSCT